MPLVIETFRSPKTPWEIFQAVHATSQACFFLDTPQYAPPDQTYSYIGTDPAFEVRLDERVFHIKGERNGKYPAGELFPILKKVLKNYQSRERNPYPFFTGGFVGYFGYEASDLCDKITFRAKPAPATPRLYLGFFRDVIVYDHQKRIYHLVTRSAQSAKRNEQREKLKSYFKKDAAKNALYFKMKKCIEMLMIL